MKIRLEISSRKSVCMRTVARWQKYIGRGRFELFFLVPERVAFLADFVEQPLADLGLEFLTYRQQRLVPQAALFGAQLVDLALAGGLYLRQRLVVFLFSVQIGEMRGVSGGDLELRANVRWQSVPKLFVGDQYITEVEMIEI